MSMIRVLCAVVMVATAACTVRTNVLTIDTGNAPGSACEVDTNCRAGAELCDGTSCTTCPDLTVCDTSGCPTGWTRLVRNGCPTCECTPPTTCSGPSDTTCTTADPTCYQSAYCAANCNAADVACCASQCGDSSCAGKPLPLGCLAACPAGPATAACTTCATTSCQCMSGAWECTVGCADGFQSACTYSAPAQPQ